MEDIHIKQTKRLITFTEFTLKQEREDQNIIK